MVVMAKTVKNRRKKNRRTKTVKKIKQIGGGPAYDEMDKIFENLIMHNLDEDVGVKDLIRLYPKLNNGDILKLKDAIKKMHPKYRDAKWKPNNVNNNKLTILNQHRVRAEKDYDALMTSIGKITEFDTNNLRKSATELVITNYKVKNLEESLDEIKTRRAVAEEAVRRPETAKSASEPDNKSSEIQSGLPPIQQKTTENKPNQETKADKDAKSAANLPPIAAAQSTQIKKTQVKTHDVLNLPPILTAQKKTKAEKKILRSQSAPQTRNTEEKAAQAITPAVKAPVADALAAQQEQEQEQEQEQAALQQQIIKDVDEAAKLKAIADEAARLKAIADADEAARLKAIADATAAVITPVADTPPPPAAVKAPAVITPPIVVATGQPPPPPVVVAREQPRVKAILQEILPPPPPSEIAAVDDAAVEATRLQAVEAAKAPPPPSAAEIAAAVKAANLQAVEAAKLQADADADAQSQALAAAAKAITDAQEAAAAKAITDAQEVAKLKAIADAQEAARLKAIADEAARLKALADAQEAARLQEIADAQEAAKLKAIADAAAATKLKADAAAATKLKADAAAATQADAAAKAITDAQQAAAAAAVIAQQQAAAAAAVIAPPPPPSEAAVIAQQQAAVIAPPPPPSEAVVITPPVAATASEVDVGDLNQHINLPPINVKNLNELPNNTMKALYANRIWARSAARSGAEKSIIDYLYNENGVKPAIPDIKTIPINSQGFDIDVFNGKNGHLLVGQASAANPNKDEWVLIYNNVSYNNGANYKYYRKIYSV